MSYQLNQEDDPRGAFLVIDARLLPKTQNKKKEEAKNRITEPLSLFSMSTLNLRCASIIIFKYVLQNLVLIEGMKIYLKCFEIMNT